MKGKLIVFNIPGCGYQIGRVRDLNKPVHSGNVEYYNNEISEDKKALQEIAYKLNIGLL